MRERVYYNAEGYDYVTRIDQASEEQVAEWLDAHYKPERLNGYDGRRERIIADRVSDLEKYGNTVISHHDAVSGCCEWITTDSTFKANAQPAAGAAVGDETSTLPTSKTGIAPRKRGAA